jgi:hypothetical protein
MSDPNVNAPKQGSPVNSASTDTAATANAPAANEAITGAQPSAEVNQAAKPAAPAAPAETGAQDKSDEQSKDVILHNAFLLGWGLVELKSRLLIALDKTEDAVAQNPKAPAWQGGHAANSDGYSDPGVRLASVWRSIFGRLALLQSSAFPECTTALTLYEPPGPEDLPYVYKPSPDYANIGIAAVKDKNDKTGTNPILMDFKLYEVTRRAINCLSLLYVTPDKSLIPANIEEYQGLLVNAILQAKEKEDAKKAGLPPPQPQTDFPLNPDNLRAAREDLTKRTVRFLDAWDGYLRENYYFGGRIPNDDLELIAYEAGNSMSSLSWGIAVESAKLEQTKETDEEKFVAAWRKIFSPQAVIRLQHQISALSSALDDQYNLQPNGKEQQPAAQPQPSTETDEPVALDPDLPSQSIQAVKHSLDYWQRAVEWIPDNLNQLRDPQAREGATWSRDMRYALTEQANIWQTLMTRQQKLSAFNMESVTQKIMEDVTDEIQAGLQQGFGESVKQAEKLAQEMTREMNTIKQSAVAGLQTLLSSCSKYIWIGIGVVAFIFVVVLVLVWQAKISSTAGATSGISTLVTALAGLFGLNRLQIVKAKQETAVEDKHENAVSNVTSQAAAAPPASSSLLTRIEGAAEQAGKSLMDAFERGYKQARIELDELNRSVAVAYPLVEFFVLSFKLKSDAQFLTDIIWSDTDREEELKRIVRAAFGSLAVFIPSGSSDSTQDKRQLPAGGDAQQLTGSETHGLNAGN